VLRIFIAIKNPSPRPGLNLRPFGTVASTLTTAPPRRLQAPYSRERIACVHWIGDWFGTRAGLESVAKKSPYPHRESNPSRQCSATCPDSQQYQVWNVRHVTMQFWTLLLLPRACRGSNCPFTCLLQQDCSLRWSYCATVKLRILIARSASRKTGSGCLFILFLGCRYRNVLG
jgi:hypothetical protein